MAIDNNMGSVLVTYQELRERERGLTLSTGQVADIEAEVARHLDALKTILNPPAEPAEPASRKGASNQ